MAHAGALQHLVLCPPLQECYCSYTLIITTAWLVSQDRDKIGIDSFRLFTTYSTNVFLWGKVLTQTSSHCTNSNLQDIIHSEDRSPYLHLQFILLSQNSTTQSPFGPESQTLGILYNSQNAGASFSFLQKGEKSGCSFSLPTCNGYRFMEGFVVEFMVGGQDCQSSLIVLKSPGISINLHMMSKSNPEDSNRGSLTNVIMSHKEKKYPGIASIIADSLTGGRPQKILGIGRGDRDDDR